MTFASRVARLEAAFGVDNEISRMTSDELHVAIMDVCTEMLASNGIGAAERAELTERLSEIKRSIVTQAKRRMQPDYARHLSWVQGTRWPNYVPALCDWTGLANGMVEYTDLERPNIMARRAALFGRPDIRALIVDGAMDA